MKKAEVKALIKQAVESHANKVTRELIKLQKQIIKTTKVKTKKVAKNSKKFAVKNVEITA